MGDTSEGQVFLGDTVLLDGEQPVTLSELLETITGVEVEEEQHLPRGVCSVCTKMALAAIHFRKVCLESRKEWAHAANCLAHISTPQAEDKAFFIIYKDSSILKEQNEVPTTQHAVLTLNKRFQPQQTIKKSLPKVKSVEGVRWRCEDCGKEFRLLTSLNLHLKMTTKRVCLLCGIIVRKEKLHQHIKKSHNIHVVHCTTCHKLFNEDIGLEYHIQTAHSILSHVCQVCNRGFVNERALRSHMYAHTLFNCLSCNSSFDNRRCYKYHIQRCKGSKRPPKSVYECHDCGTKYIKKGSLRTHIQHKHLHVLTFMCHECGKRCPTLGHLRAHEAIHMSKRKVFQCYCGAKMKTELGFNLHQRIHSGEKPYECKQCGDRFLSSSRRLDHIKRRHTSVKDMPHPCTKCSASFIRPSLLKKHFQVAHGASN